MDSSSVAFEREGKSGRRGPAVRVSVLAGQDLPHDEVAALGFSQEGLQFHWGVLAVLCLAILVT